MYSNQGTHRLIDKIDATNEDYWLIRNVKTLSIMYAWAMNIGQRFIIIGEAARMDIKLETGKYKKINKFVNQYDSLTCIDDMEIWKFADEWPRIMVRINPSPNNKGVKFHSLYNIFYAIIVSNWQMLCYINNSLFLVLIDPWNETMCSLWTLDIQSFQYFKRVSFNKLGYWREQGLK